MFKITHWLLTVGLLVTLAACSGAATEPAAVNSAETPANDDRALTQVTASVGKPDSAETDSASDGSTGPIVTTAEPESVKPGDGDVDSAQPDLDSVVVAPAADMTVQVGETFTLRPGETALVDDQRVYVTFVEVSDDSRCPENVACVWAGMATVLLELTDGAGVASTQQMQLEGGMASSSAELLPGMTFMLLSVEPYPTGDAPIDADAYTITLETETRAIRPIEQ